MKPRRLCANTLRASDMRDWEYRSLRDLVGSPISGSRPAGGVREDTEGVPSLGGENVLAEGGMTYRVLKKIPHQFYALMSKGKLRNGDVLINKDGAQTGKVGLYAGEFDRAAVNEHLFILRCSDGAIDERFLYYSLLRRGTQEAIARQITGSAQPGLASTFVDHVRIPLPTNLVEQRCVARVLLTIDTAINETRAIIAKLKAVKQGLLDDLLTRGIDANGELRPPQAEAPHLYKESTLGWIPKEWESLPLEQVTDTPICYGIVQVFGFVPNGVPVLAIRDLRGDYTTGVHRTALRIDAAYPRSRVRPGDVLLSIKGTLGRVGVVPSHFTGNISRDIALIRPTPRVRSQYLAQMLQSTIGQRLLSLAQVGTTRGEISIAPLRRIVVSLPDIEEQQRLEASFEASEVRIKQEELTLQKLRSEKVGLMDDLLTGRVRVTPLLAEAAQQQGSA